MRLQNYNIIFTTVSVTAFIVALAFFIFAFSQIDTAPIILKNITPYSFILLDISLLIILYYAGLLGGLISFALSIPLVILASFSLNSAIYNFQLIIMLGISISSYICYKRNRGILLENDEEAEKNQEQKNLLEDRIKKDASLIEALSKKLDRYNSLKDLGEVFNAKLSLADICQITIDRAYNIVGKTDEAKLFLFSEDTQSLVLCWWKSKDELNIPSKVPDVFDRWVFEKRQPLQISDAATDFRFNYQQAKEKPRYSSLLIVPLIIQHRIIGILRLSNEKVNSYAGDDLRLLDFISDLASAAINNSRLYIQTQELAIRDSLTGLYVHRYFKERLSKEFTRCKENNVVLSMLMLDIDNFKDYNDKYGHAAGDKVLKGITDIMRHNTQQSGILARYGGEEFVVLLAGVQKEKAKKAAENIRKDIESTRFVLRRQETNITVSIGVSSFPQDASSEEELLKRVDFLLYKAKREGRNKVCID